MKTLNYLNGLILACFLTYGIQAKRDYTIEILDFQANATRGEFFKTPISSSFTKQQFSVEFTLAQRVSQWSAILAVDTLADGKPRANELKLETNLCSCLKSGCRNNFVAMLFKATFRSSNFPKGCPLISDNTYYIKNYTVRSDDFPPFLPAIDWQLRVEMIFNKKSAMIWFMRGRTVGKHLLG